ncbi:MAG: S8 family serine peptidase, partial [Flavobacteriales bacterium]|nr:S8 family serine peptidase [Flavobacteriales bacterium]
MISDPYYSQQWGINNTGQYGNQYAGIDLNTEKAWTITSGSGANVAIFDHGFEMNHPDLMSNVVNNGFDAKSGSSPSQVRGDHGTACAGIVGAPQNNLGVSGVAPDATLTSISINLTNGDTPQQLASGFNWARTKGVDVISNSWGGYTPSSILSDAIWDCLTLGRNGLGTVVVFAAGNENNQNVRWPGSQFSEILLVGAMSPCGERKNPSSCDGEGWGSCYGPLLDIVAPGVKIYTTDNAPTRSGRNGYSNGDYHATFNGTSSACPAAAGVCALILAQKPSLKRSEVVKIIESTARKVRSDIYTYSNNGSRPNGSWNANMGYGLIDAYEALLGLGPIHANFEISGDSKGCPGNSFTPIDKTVSNNPVTSWKWIFPGGSPSSSSLQSPTVSYNAPGSYDITLIVSNNDGTDTITKPGAIEIEDPTACLSGIYNGFSGNPVSLLVSFTGKAPWSFVYTDGTNNYNVNSVYQNPFVLNVSPTSSTNYSLVSFSDSTCTGNICSDQAVVNIFGNPFNTSWSYGYGNNLDNDILDVDYCYSSKTYLAISNNGTQGVVSKIDAEGKIIWSRELSDSASYEKIKVGPNGEVMTLGIRNLPGNIMNFVVTRLSATGNVIWSKEFTANTRELSADFNHLGNDEYVISSRHLLSKATGVDGALFLKIDGNGNVLNSVAANNGDNEFFDACPNPYGGITQVGKNYTAGKIGCIAEFDKNGNVLRSKMFDPGGQRILELIKVIPSPDGGYIVGAAKQKYTSPHDEYLASIIKLSSNLDIVWQQDMITWNKQVTSHNMDIEVANNGDVYVSYGYNNAPIQNHVRKFSASGSLIWTKKRPGLNAVKMYNNGNPNNGFLAHAFSDTSYFGGRDAVLFRTDTGFNNCLLVDVTFGTLNEPQIGERVWSLNSSTTQFTETTNNSVASSNQYARIDLCNGSVSLNYTISSSVVCNTNLGNAKVDIVSGNPPYNYLWSNGATSDQINNIVSGNYSVTVWDANDTVVKSVVVPNYAPLQNSFSYTSPIFGAGGSIVSHVSSGASPYQYLWSNGGQSASISNLTPGWYNLTVVDDEGCTLQDSMLLQDSAVSCEPFVFTLTLDKYPAETSWEIVDAQGNIVLSGGPYGPAQALTTIRDSICLFTGCYTLRVKDSYGDGLCCQYGNGSFLLENLSGVVASGGSFGREDTTNFCVQAGPVGPDITVLPTVDCKSNNLGKIEVIVNSGTPPYSYQWSNGSTNHQINGVSSGSYSVTVTDANGNATETANIPNYSPLANSFSYVSPIQGTGGTVSSHITGGQSPYKYSWSTGGQASSISNLPPGWYNLTCLDNQGCSLPDSIELQDSVVSNCNPIVMTITFDQYPDETSWEITDDLGVIVMSGDNYGPNTAGTKMQIPGCLPNGCYKLKFMDSHGDGICCDYGLGSYTLDNQGTVLATGGSFGLEEVTPFCLSGQQVPDTCNGKEIFISEYLEGFGYNKAIEIYNPTLDTVDMSKVSLVNYKDGSNTATSSVTMSGTLLPHETYVIVHSRANSSLESKADFITNNLRHNGDDAIVLTRNNVKVDIFGRQGHDPGTGWRDANGIVRTRNGSLRRYAY